MGGIGLWGAAILDGADGILARAKNMQSEFGRALDGSADALVAVFTVFPAFYHIWVTNHDPYQLLMMAPALLLTVVHLAVYDFYKESYLQATRPGQGSEGNDIDQIEATVKAAKSKGPIVQMAMNVILVPHLKRQKAVINWINPDAWTLSHLLHSDEQTSRIYREENVWPMRLWALVSLAPHAYLMAICAMSNRLDVYLFIRLFVMNGIFVVAAVWQRIATGRTIRRLAGAGTIQISGLDTRPRRDGLATR